MKYRVDLTINGFLEIEADSQEEAQAKATDGYSLTDVTVESDEIDEVSLLG